ncbi:hypothetical protein BBF96_15110 [Anoxybacter fermentans]|uniref:Molybdenum hydroxylase n=1 Tax=Anoxybacter fermentans TaxID=1323375 RepID=A0A3Q9HSX7_9FIRM|nr:selenium-dependent molybdenum cofactor biosynthesis protein YqeB [Anoxybacter fermentans]AZR74585.1 hypothetical protein BBF96_15110 [Anoxybacter fermentans]
MRLQEVKVVIRGGGDLATGVAYRLSRAGFRIIVTELAEPLVVRRTVSLAEAIYRGRMEVEGMIGICVNDLKEAVELVTEGGVIPVLIDPDGKILKYWKPTVVVDAIMAKRNLAGTKMTDAPVVIGLGPGFRAGEDVHAVVETKRGHFLGRVLYEGEALANTGIPGIVAGIGRERVVYSPVAGVFKSEREIGDMIEAGEVFGWIEETPIYAKISGCIRGLLKPGIRVKANVKVGDIDPRKDVSYCYTISDKALAVGGGVLEAVLSLLQNIVEI